MNKLWWKLFWRTALRITSAGFILGGLYAPIFYTLVWVSNLLFNGSNSGNLAAIWGLYMLGVVFGAGFGCVFGTILGAIMGIMQGLTTLIVLRFVTPGDEIRLKYSLTASSFIAGLIVSYFYFARLFPGTWSAILIMPLIIAVIANVWIVRKMGEWYLSEAASSLPDEFYDEP